jgi:glycerol-3-phosphate dehydrogenase
MTAELGWSSSEARVQLEKARSFIDLEMGQEARAQSVNEITLNLTREEVKAAKERFNLLDKERKGRITVNDLRRHFRVSIRNGCVRMAQ